VKPFFSPLTELLAMVWVLMALGVLWLLVRGQLRSALWLGIPTALLLLLGSTPIAESLVAAEGAEGKAEKQKTEMLKTGNPSPGEGPSAPVDGVVALGGGDRISQHDVLGFAIYDGGSRLLTAIELVRTGRAKTLVLGGSGPVPSNSKLPAISVVQAWVSSWGLISGGMTNVEICFTTHDEALAFKKLKESEGRNSVLLVTSALHIRRSEALFRKQDVQVVPVAAGFQVYGVPREMPFSPFPRQQRFYLPSLYLHEKIGWCLYRWRGWV
jgi:uncharacterized SAM-binding protein YcdF (DUF218 family)